MSTILLLLGVTLLILSYFYVVLIKNYKRKYRLIDIIKNDWDSIKDIDFELSYIKDIFMMYRYYDKLSTINIDDITWNDFEMDAIFDRINYTYSTMGEIYLYNMLRNPTNDIEILKERDRIIEYYSKNEEDRIKKQYQLNNIGKFNKTSIYIYKDIIESISRYNIIPHIAIPMLLLLSIIFVVANAKYGIILFIFTIVINLLIYYNRNKNIEIYLPIIMQIGSMLNSIKELNDMKENKELNQYSNILSKTAKLSQIYRRYFRFYGSITLGKLSDLDTIYDSIIKPFFHTDLIVFRKLINLIQNNMQLLIEAYETVGFIDAMIAISAFRHKTIDINGNCFCKPDFDYNTTIYNVEDIYNPLLLEPITNSIKATGSILITGSNATGKSTFLRTIGINSILAQSIYTVCAKKYSASFFKVMSSMSLKDSIFSGESYYMKEIKALKRILDGINEAIPILCCIDEVLRGTNTIERIAASSKILENLAMNNVLCFVASHDLELTYIVNKYFNNYHFQENVDDYGVTCDFKLYNDRSYTRNAINLLKFLGYSNDIVDDAKKRANDYIQSGKWT